MAISNEKFPFVCGILELVEVKCSQIVEKKAFDLATEYVKLGAENIQGMAISPGWSCPRRYRTRPLSGSYKRNS